MTDLAAPVLDSVTQLGPDQAAVTWEPYLKIEGNPIVTGNIQGFADQGAEVHVIGAFVHPDILPTGSMTVPLDPGTQPGANVRVVMSVQESGGQPVESDPITFVYDPSASSPSPAGAAKGKGHDKGHGKP